MTHKLVRHLGVVLARHAFTNSSWPNELLSLRIFSFLSILSLA